MSSSSSSHRYSPYSSSSSSYDSSSPAYSDSTRYSSPRSDYGSPASSAANSPASYNYVSPKSSTSLSSSSSIPSLSYRPARDNNSKIVSQYYLDERNEMHKTKLQVDRSTDTPSFQLIRGDGPKPYVVIPHGVPNEFIRTACIQFSRAAQVEGSWMRIPGICLRDPQRDLQNRKSKPFSNRRHAESDRMNLHLEWPGQQLGSMNHKADGARRVVLTRGGEMTLEDLAFAVSEFVTEQLIRVERMGQPPGCEHWQLQSRRSPQGIKIFDIAVWGICELYAGHWQVILHWFPSGKDLP